MKKDIELYEASGDDIPYEELTVLLHKAYKKHSNNDLNYAAAKQDVEATKRRIGNGSCILVKYKGVLAATITFNEIKNKSYRWYERGYNIYISQMAVDPEYSKTRVYLYLATYLSNKVKKGPYDACIADTSVEATELVNHYVKIGFQIIAYKSWPGTNYYSYIFRIPSDHGKVYSDRFCKFMLTMSKFFCIVKQRKDGTYRFPFSVLKKGASKLKQLLKKVVKH